MTIQVRKGGAWREITGAKVYANSAWRTVVAIRVYKGGAWRLVGNYTPPPGGTGSEFSLTAGPATDFVSARAGTITSDSIAATPSGGLAPYTYAWSYVSGYASITFSNSGAAVTTVTASSVQPPGTSETSVIHCVCTDSLGITATSNNVSISFTHESGA